MAKTAFLFRVVLLAVFTKYMCTFMNSKICLVTKALTTLFTCEWLLSCVSSDVSNHVTLLRKRFLTKCAWKDSLVGVGVSVSAQGTLSRKCRRAEITEVGFNLEMDRIDMDLDIIRLLSFVFTLVTMKSSIRLHLVSVRQRHVRTSLFL